MWNNKLYLALSLMTLMLLSACDATKGIGQDLEKADEKIEEVAIDKGTEG